MGITYIRIFGKWDNLVHLPYKNLLYCTQHNEIQCLCILFIKKEQKFYQIRILVNI